MLLIALLSGCIENSLSGEKPSSDDPGPDTQPPGQDSGADSAGESGVDSALDAPCTVEPAPTGPSSGAATCSALLEVAWDLALELDFHNLDDSGAGTYIGSPVVAPIVAGGPPAILFQTALASSGGSVLGIDGSGVVVFRIDEVGYDLDHLAVIRDAIGGGAGVARFGVPTLPSGVVCATADGRATEHAAFVMSAPGFLDVDHDGVAELIEDNLVLDADCEVVYEAPFWLWNSTTSLVDLTGQFDYALVSGEGVSDTQSGLTSPWEFDGEFAYYSVFNVASLAEGDDLLLLAVNKYWILLARADGSLRWSLQVPPAPDGYVVHPPAVGDLDGDGAPELVIRTGSVYGPWMYATAYDLDGNVLWRQLDSGASYSGGGGLALADLDADGSYEVIDWSDMGLRVLDGVSGQVLAERTDVFNRAAFSEPVIADVDADGSAEIVVAGDWTAEDGADEGTVNDHLFVFGAASGRFARTRPVWNQTSYDITTLRDDGTTVRFPRASWQSYNAFKAQPSHDGARPDLTVTVTDVCADLCGPGGSVQVGVQVANLGSVEAAAGGAVRLFTWTQSAGVREVASATMSSSTPSMWSNEGVVFTVPWEDWGDGQFVQVDGAHADECDLVNDRIDILDDPCE